MNLARIVWPVLIPAAGLTVAARVAPAGVLVAANHRRD